MLARLDEVPGVRESRVEWTGRYVLVGLEQGADEEATAVRAAEVLGNARRSDPEDEARCIAEFRAGEPWMRSGETLKLSEREAEVLGRRLGAEAAKGAGLGPEQTEKVIAIVEDELRLAFERTHKRGEDRPVADERAFRLAQVKERCRAFLTEAEAEVVAEALVRAFGAK